MQNVNLVLTVAVLVKVPDDYTIDPDNLFIENESLSLKDMRDNSFQVTQFETLDVEVQKPITFDN